MNSDQQKSDLPAIALIGAGSMGGAMLRAWLETASIDPKNSCVLDPAIDAGLAEAARAYGLSINPPAAEINADFAILAVKPQIAGEVLAPLGHALKNLVIVSVMAGTSIANLSIMLDGAQKIIRAMPNLPSLYGAGATGLFAGAGVSAAERQSVGKVMTSVGSVHWVDDEEAIDFVAAVSGSGPAYFFLLVEAMGDAGVELGLPRAMAEALARETLIGAGIVLDNDDRSPTKLREMVTSPGGTTAAALGVFDGDDNAMRDLVKHALRAAVVRAKALSG